MEAPDTRRDVDLHSAVIGHWAGKLAVALILTVGCYWIFVPNLPASAVRSRLEPSWRPATEIGLVQDWAVFSPNPRSQSIDVRARIEHDDGSIEFWDVPEFDPGFGAFREYRWHKWQERLRLDNRRKFWLPTAQWIADEHRVDGRRPASVTLIRRWIDHDPLQSDGTTIDDGWNEFEFFVWERDG